MNLHLLLWVMQWTCTIIGALVLAGWALRGIVLGVLMGVDWVSTRLYLRALRRRRMGEEIG
jgi:hypothetical protein